MRPIDRWLVSLGTPLVVAGLAWGAARADEPDAVPEGPRTFAPGGAVETPAVAPPSGAPGAVSATDGRPAADIATNPLMSLRIVAAEGTTLVPWDVLKSYEYQEGLKGLPPEIRALDGQRVTMAGFLLPLYEFEDIHEFALVGNHWSCCFGQPPSLSGVVSVVLRASEPGLPNTSEPLRIVGTFRAREVKEAGYVLSIYTIDDASASVVGY